jgi:hypothetical protein
MCSVRGKLEQNNLLLGKRTATPLQAWRGPEGSRRLRLPDFMTMARSPALRAGPLYPPFLLGAEG